jgi:hypothetical protein
MRTCTASYSKEAYLKTELKLRALAFWQVLSEVPGYPDAPRALRIRRVLPVALPLAGMTLLALWSFAWVEPQRNSARRGQAPIIALAREVAELQSMATEEEAVAIAKQAAEAANAVLEKPDEIGAQAAAFQAFAAKHGWEASVQTLPPPSEPPAPGGQITFIGARARLKPSVAQNEAFASLLTLLEQLSSQPKRIDLTRLVVRADEGGRHSVEMNLRWACRYRHEKVSE